MYPQMNGDIYYLGLAKDRDVNENDARDLAGIITLLRTKVRISLDTKSSGDQIVELGLSIFAFDQTQLGWQHVRNVSACFHGLSFDPEEKTNLEYWAREPHNKQFHRIALYARPEVEQLTLVNIFLDEISRRSSSVEFLARPAAYDYHVLTEAIKRARVHVPSVKNPLKSGGSSTVICAGNAANAYMRLFRLENPLPSYETLMFRCTGARMKHNAAEDAWTQGATFLIIEERMASMDIGSICYPDNAMNIYERVQQVLNLFRPESVEEIKMNESRRREATEEEKKEFESILNQLSSNSSS